MDFFFQIWATKSLKKIGNLLRFFLATNTCTHRGPIFPQGERRPRTVDVLGHWELTLIQRWRAEGMVVSLPFFIYFARLVAIRDKSDSKNCIVYLLKQF